MKPGNILILSKRSLVTVKPHTPMIKFRNGGNDGKFPPSGTTSSGSHNQSNAGGPSGPRPVLEDYQLPFRYRRRPLDEAEINAINSGGVF